jgi:uncharacterized protein YjbI with pentapeptide repeats
VEPDKTPRERTEDLIRLLVGDWQPNTWLTLWGVRIAIVFGVLFALGLPYGITLWDWMQLLVVPAVLAGIGLWFNRKQQERQREDNQAQHDLRLEIETQRAQDQALVEYMDRIGQMLRDRETPLRSARTQAEERESVPDEYEHWSFDRQREYHRAQSKQHTVAQAQVSMAHALTVDVLPRLDGRRKGRVAQFLYENGLIGQVRRVENMEGEYSLSRSEPVIDLRDGALSGAYLRGVYLRGANLSGAKLRGTDLRGAMLRGTDLRGAYLREADLRGADLMQATLRGADLSYGNLENTKLTGADLTSANLHKVDLRRTRLNQATMRGTNLRGAAGLSDKALEHKLKKAKTLEGATMPNGQKYEDWLKSKGSGEDEKDR